MLLILNCITEISGWSPIHHMVDLAAGLLEAEVVPVGSEADAIMHRMLGVLSTRKRSGRDVGLMICAGPADLRKVFGIAGWKHRFRFLAAWIIDSFWVDHIPRSVARSRPFDHIFITSLEDMDQWKSATGVPISWLPWGSDVLGLGSSSSLRPWDITRVGRQPKDWEDDSRSAADAARAGLKFRGRPPGHGLTALEAQRYIMQVYSESKYVLAFSNLANPEAWTHPTRDYLTGRWADALACGAVVAGIPPRGPSARELLWPEAILNLESVQRSNGLAVLADAVAGWTEEIPRRNYAMALQKLDWRWRFRDVAELVGIDPVPLARDLARMRERLR